MGRNRSGHNRRRVYGNAGAFEGNMAGNLIWAEILTESSANNGLLKEWDMLIAQAY